MTNHLEGRTVVVTGAGSGFGRLVTCKAAALGANVVGGDLNAESLAETVDLAHEAGHRNVVGIETDVTDLAQMQALAAAAVDGFGALDIMVNNAGTMPLAFYRDHAAAAEAWTRCIDINIKGVLHGIVAAHDQMISQGHGHVINLSSIYGNAPTSGAGVYGATKAAVNFLSDSLRQESQGKIKVTTIRPTGVPGTNLGGGIINPEAISGIIDVPSLMSTMERVMSDNPPAELIEDASIQKAMLDPETLADNIIYAMNQPWGVSISDITVRASGDGYRL